jgi:hypothetical protein
MVTRKKSLREKIQVACGILKRKPGDKSFAEEWAEHKRAEMELEDAKFVRCTTGSAVLPPRWRRKRKPSLSPATRSSSRSKRKSKSTG